MAASVVAEWPRVFIVEEMFLSLSWKSLQSMEEEIMKDESYMENQENGVPMCTLTTRVQMHATKQEERREGRGERQKR